MDSSIFRLSDRPDVVARLPQMAARSPIGALIDGNAFAKPLKSTIRDMGSVGMYASAGDYMKLLMALLRNDGTLLSKGSVAELSTLQVKDSAYLADDRNANFFEKIWPEGAKVKCNHGLGELVNMEDLRTGRKRGSIMCYRGDMIAWISPDMPRSVLKHLVLTDHWSGLTRKARCAASSARR
jgi:hypothetical protein